MSTLSLYANTDQSLYSLYNNTLNTTSGAASQTVQTAEAGEPQSTAATRQEDTVKLSETAQAKLLYQQGSSVNTIAATLGATTKEVNNDLGITEEKAIEQTLEATLSAK
jgi:hypothetical protein